MAKTRVKKVPTARSRARHGKVLSSGHSVVHRDGTIKEGAREGKDTYPPTHHKTMLSRKSVTAKGVFRVEENRKGFDTTRIFEKLGLIETSSDNGKKK